MNPILARLIEEKQDYKKAGKRFAKEEKESKVLKKYRKEKLIASEKARLADIKKLKSMGWGIEDVEEEELVDSQQKAYCVKCKSKEIMMNPHETMTSNGRRMMKGECPNCGTTMNRFLPNS
jgi:hypothetical protein